MIDNANSNYTKDENHIFNLLSNEKSETSIVIDNQGELFWWSGMGGWGEPEMHPMQSHYADAARSLLKRTILTITKEKLSALLMETKEVDGRKVTQCTGRWSSGRRITLTEWWDLDIDAIYLSKRG